MAYHWRSSSPPRGYGAWAPVEILDRLRDRFRLLAGAAWSAVPRQRTTSAAVDWSYTLLGPEEKTVFQRLGVFAGGFDLRAAERVGADPLLPAERVWDTLSHLVDKSMVQREERSDRSRYRLLDTIRAFALDRALETDDLEAVRRSHAEYFHDVCEAAEPFLIGSEQVDWLDRLEVEKDNLRAALQWSAQRSPELCLRMATTTREFWTRRMDLGEGCELMRMALSVDDRPTVARGRLLTAIARLENWTAQYEHARTHAAESVRILREHDDLVGLAEALTWTSAVHLVGFTDRVEALQAAQAAAEVARAAADDRALGIAVYLASRSATCLTPSPRSRKALRTCVRRTMAGTWRRRSTASRWRYCSPVTRSTPRRSGWRDWAFR